MHVHVHVHANMRNTIADLCLAHVKCLTFFKLLYSIWSVHTYNVMLRLAARG